jgi:inner membrane protein COX18
MCLSVPVPVCHMLWSRRRAGRPKTAALSFQFHWATVAFPGFHHYHNFSYTTLHFNTMFASRAAHASCNARARFLSLPSHLRLSSHSHSHQQSKRSFSASPSTKIISPTDILAAPSLAVLESLHFVGLPWYAVIPTAAILVRGVFGYYTAAVPARRRQQIRSDMNPVLAANIRLDMQLNPKGTGTYLGSLDLRPGLFKKIYPNWLALSRSHELGKKFGAPMVAMSSWVNIFTLIATAESMRMLCGAREGLLSTLLTPVTMLGRHLAPEYFPPGVEGVDAFAEAYANRVEQVRQVRLQSGQEDGGNNGLDPVDLEALSGNILQSPNPLHSQVADTAAPHFDPSLQTEGLFWCADLTAIDPYAVLPMLTSAAMICNVLLNPQKIPSPTSLPDGKIWQPLRFLVQRYSFGQKFIAGLACLVGYGLQNLPAAVVLYIFSSVVTGFAQRRWLDTTMPLRPPMKPCVRRTRVRSKKMFSVRQ